MILFIAGNYILFCISKRLSISEGLCF